MNDSDEDQILMMPPPRWLQKGLRKVTVLGGPMAGLLVIATVAMFTRKMEADQWAAFSIEVLKWGGAIFAGANVLEHGAILLAKIGLTTKGKR